MISLERNCQFPLLGTARGCGFHPTQGPPMAWGFEKPNTEQGCWSGKEMRTQDCKVTQFYFGFWRPDGALLRCTGIRAVQVSPPQGGGPATWGPRRRGGGLVDGRFQGPSDRSGLHKERRGIRQQPAMAQIGGQGRGESERTESPRTGSRKGGPVPFTLPLRLRVREVELNCHPAGGRAWTEARRPKPASGSERQPAASTLTEGARGARALGADSGGLSDPLLLSGTPGRRPAALSSSPSRRVAPTPSPRSSRTRSGPGRARGARARGAARARAPATSAPPRR